MQQKKLCSSDGEVYIGREARALGMHWNVLQRTCSSVERKDLMPCQTQQVSCPDAKIAVSPKLYILFTLI